jgi:hypothetical protein
MLDSGTYNILARCSKVFTIDDEFIKCHFTVRTVDKDGNIEYKLPNGWLHNTNRGVDGLILPAVIYANGSQYWYKNGKEHRDERGPDGLVLPAEIWTNGNRFWYKDGKQHRDECGPDGLVLPAEIWTNGSQFWHNNGVSFVPKP